MAEMWAGLGRWVRAKKGEGDGGEVRMVSWNVGNLRSVGTEVEGFSQLADVIQRTDPDVLMLQECQTRVGKEPRKLHGAGGYTVYHSSLPRTHTRGARKAKVLPPHHVRDRAGVATLVKESLLRDGSVEVVGATPGSQGYALSLRLETNRGRVVLTNLYVPPEAGDGCRVRVLEEIEGHLGEVGGMDFPVIVGGDMNAAWLPGDRGPGGLTPTDKGYKKWACAQGLCPVDMGSAGGAGEGPHFPLQRGDRGSPTHQQDR